MPQIVPTPTNDLMASQVEVTGDKLSVPVPPSTDWRMPALSAAGCKYA